MCIRDSTGVELREAQLAAMLGLALFTILLPVSGYLSDRFGRRPMLLFFALGSGATFIPLVNTIGQTMSSVLVAVSVSAVFLAAYAGSLAAVMVKPVSRGTPWAGPPSPVVTSRSERSLTSTHRCQVTRRGSMPRRLPWWMWLSMRAARVFCLLYTSPSPRD